MEYWVGRTCKSCGNEDYIELTKVQSAFHLYDESAIWKQACSVCQSTECQSTSHPLVTLDKELLDFWGNDAHLTMMPQDEELFLAEVEYLPMILEAIDENKYLPLKQQILLEALCVLLYDHVADSFNYSPEENLQRQQIADQVKPELVKRKELIQSASASIMDYIKDVVFPEIGLKQ